MTSLAVWIRDKLKDPRLARVDINSPNLIDVHQGILRQKPMMQGVFKDFYDICISARDRFFDTEGMELEIGAGISLFKEFYPHVVTTDVKQSRWVDRALDAQHMSIAAESVRAVYGINCFHHLPEPRRFFSELRRVLKRGGGCVLIEPYYGLGSRMLYPRLHAQESFVLGQATWEAAPGSTGYMSGANQALSYVVFKRDRSQFEAEFPELEIVQMRHLSNYLRYLLSGGLNFRQLVPSSLIPIVKLLEWVLKPIEGALALHHVIVIRKKG